MDVDESSSETPNSSYGNPQFIQNVETIYGLDVDSKELPPLESLLGRYSWVETGFESPCGPQLDQGMTLQVKEPAGEVKGSVTFLDNAGVITAIRRCNPKQGDIPPSWQCDVTWNVSDESKAQAFPTKAHIYVGIVLDDNNAPFLEVVFRAGKAVQRPYGYAKRQADEGEAVGLSDAEKERLNFLTIADYDAMMDIKEDEQRKLMDERLLKEKLEKEERQKQEIEREKRQKERQKEVAEQRRKEKEERNAREAAERLQQPKPQESIQKPRGVHDGMTNKQRKAAQKKKIYDERRTARWEREDAERLKLMQEERDRRIKESQQARGNLVEEQKRLIKEESRFDLLRNLPSAASGSNIQTSHTAHILPPKREEGVSIGFRGFSNATVKQEEVLPTLDQRGIKRTHPDDPSNDSKKRIKLEY